MVPHYLFSAANSPLSTPLNRSPSLKPQRITLHSIKARRIYDRHTYAYVAINIYVLLPFNFLKLHTLVFLNNSHTVKNACNITTYMQNVSDFSDHDFAEWRNSTAVQSGEIFILRNKVQVVFNFTRRIVALWSAAFVRACKAFTVILWLRYIKNER